MIVDKRGRVRRAVARPKAPDTLETVAAILDELEHAPQRAAGDFAVLSEHALAIASHGLAARAAAIVKRWRTDDPDDPELRLVQALFLVFCSPPTASTLLQEGDASDPAITELAVVAHFFRGELDRAISLAESRRWFVDGPVGDGRGMFYGAWALALVNRLDEAQHHIEAWKRARGRRHHDAYELVLRAEARLAAFRHDYDREVMLLEEALAIARQHELAVARMFIEPLLAIAYARVGDAERASAITRRWDAARSREPEAPRDLARLEIGLLDGDFANAWRAGQRVLQFARSTGHAPLACQVRFDLVLAANAAQLPTALEAFAALVHRHQILAYRERLRLLEAIVRPRQSLREIEVVERGHARRAQLSLVRLWTPRQASLAADLYWDRVRGCFFFGGRGPHALSEHPVLRRLLEAILASPKMSLTLAECFSEVWGMPYDPFVHENKVHVAVHRLRAWLASCGAKPGIIRVRDGAIGVDPTLDVRVVELARRRKIESPPEQMPDRILQCLDGAEAVPTWQLQSQLGISRSPLHRALRSLVARGRVERIGRGPATRYRRVSARR